MFVTDERSGAAVKRTLRAELPVRPPRAGDRLVVFASKLLSSPPPLPDRARLVVVLDSRLDAKTAKLVRSVASMLPSAFAADVDVARRLLAAAKVPGSAKHLIADAKVLGSELVVTTCDMGTFRVPVSKVRALAKVPARKLPCFLVEGSGLHWPDLDVDIGLDGLRQAVDPELKATAIAKTLEHNARYGAAIRAEREAAGLGQDGIDGLSERSVRRIEQGGQSHVRVASLRKLAAAHGISLAQYMDRLARRMAKAKRSHRG